MSVTLITTLASALLVVCFLVFWCYQFIELMLLSESDFPGKYDKILWAAVFFLLFFIAPIVFVGWKNAYLAMRAAESRMASGSWKQKYEKMKMREKEEKTQD